MFVNRLLEKGLSVCITALANKALIEVCSKEELLSAAFNKKVYKTSLKENEKIEIPGIQVAPDGLQVEKGKLLLSTFYALSEMFSGEQSLNIKVFDVLVIEEASQAFLPTIAAFSQLAEQILMVGDPMQMAPIVLKKEQLFNENIYYSYYAAGLSSIAVATNIDAYLLNETYRLSDVAAKQTGVFYNNKLMSQQPVITPLKVSDEYQKYINPERGGQKYCDFNLLKTHQHQKAIKLSLNLIANLVELNPKSKFSILSPYRKTVLNIQDLLFQHSQTTKNLTIETIDRVQGITVDYCIIILPLKRVSFELNKERFNVATSRATHGTLLIISEDYKHYSSVSSEVSKFIDALPTIR